MTDHAAILGESLGKKYKLTSGRQYTTLRDRLTDLFRFRAPTEPIEAHEAGELWAVRDLSFSVEPGEVVGVIGRNGAGKSTLLKLVSRITDPTEGRLRLRGRIASLLEVGTGFHPELSGRENVYLNGAILGMTRSEIRQRFDQIVAFAELERFIDVPVKRYSSGMYMRLAFSVAAHLEADILLVDEVLAVGDREFQQKCIGRLDAARDSGRAVLFVSHDLHAVSTLTTRCLLLEHGKLIFDGPTSKALELYRNQASGKNELEYVAAEKQNGLVRLTVKTSTGGRVHHHGEPLVIEALVNFAVRPKAGAFSFQLVDASGRPIVHAWLLESDRSWSRQGEIALTCTIPAPRMYMGQFSVSTHLSDRGTQEHFETLHGLCEFEVVMDGIPREYEWVAGTCTYLEDVQWSAR